MARQKKPAPIVVKLDAAAWMLTFSDLLTLLLAFFVLLLTMASMDDRKFREAFGMFSGAFGTLAKHSEAGMSPDFIVPIAAPVPEILVADLKDMLDRHMREKSTEPKSPPEIAPEPEPYRRLFETEEVPDGIVVRIAGSVLFEAGSTRLDRAAQDLLAAVAVEVAEANVPLRVECYVPPMDADRDTAWGLSLDRAGAVATVLGKERGLVPANLSLMGYGRPVPRTLKLDRDQDMVVLKFFTRAKAGAAATGEQTGAGTEGTPDKVAPAETGAQGTEGPKTEEQQNEEQKENEDG